MRPQIGRAVLGGLVGTLGITMLMYWVGPLMGLMRMDLAEGLGTMLGIGWAGGLIAHFMNGTIIFPLVYALGLFGVLPGSPLLKGLTWGAALWLLAQVAVMPMLGGGLFSANMGGIATAAGSLMGHLVYGGLLGGIAGGGSATAPFRNLRSHA